MKSLNSFPQKKILVKSKKERVAEALQSLKEKGAIRDFLPLYTGVKRIDFYVVYVRERYKVCPLSVTGKYWINAHCRERDHSEIEIDFWESRELIEKKILQAIQQGEWSLRSFLKRLL